MSGIDIMNVIEILFGSGVLVTFFVWVVNHYKKAGADATMSKLLSEEVQKIKEDLAAQEKIIKDLEKCMNKIDLDMSVEIAAIKTDIMHIRELQSAQGENLVLIASGINKLLDK